MKKMIVVSLIIIVFALKGNGRKFRKMFIFAVEVKIFFSREFNFAVSQNHQEIYFFLHGEKEKRHVNCTESQNFKNSCQKRHKNYGFQPVRNLHHHRRHHLCLLRLLLFLHFISLEAQNIRCSFAAMKKKQSKEKKQEEKKQSKKTML